MRLKLSRPYSINYYGKLANKSKEKAPENFLKRQPEVPLALWISAVVTR